MCTLGLGATRSCVKRINSTKAPPPWPLAPIPSRPWKVASVRHKGGAYVDKSPGPEVEAGPHGRSVSRCWALDQSFAPPPGTAKATMEEYHRPCDEVPPLQSREAPLALVMGTLSGGLLMLAELGCGIPWTWVCSAGPGSFLPLGSLSPQPWKPEGGLIGHRDGLGDRKLSGAVCRV